VSENPRPLFSIRPALLCAAAAFSIGNLAIFAYGAKSCGGISWGFYEALLSPIYLILPWFNLPLLLAFAFGGFIYPRIERLRSWIGVIAIVLAITIPTVTALMTARVSFTCQPI
jgi:hypothetical protein